MSVSKYFNAALLVAGALAAPSDDFDLRSFKLTTPRSQEAYFGVASARGEDGAAEIYLAHCDEPAYTGLGIDAGFEDDEFFYSADNGAMVFYTALDGSASGPDSSNWRSELRELIGGECESELANWAPEGINAMHATLRVVEVAEEDPQTVVGKILAENTDKTLVKLQYDGPSLPIRAIINADPILGEPFSLTFAAIPGYGMFSYVISLVDDTLTMSVTIDGETATKSVTFGEGDMSDLWRDYMYYFRAGSNPQADTDIGGAFEVHFHELEVAHSEAPGRRGRGRGPRGGDDEQETAGPEVFMA